MSNKFKITRRARKEGVDMLAVKKNVSKNPDNKYSPAKTEDVMKAIVKSNKKHSKMMTMLAK